MSMFMSKYLGMTKKTLKDLVKEAGYTYRGLAEEIDTTPDAIVAWGNRSRVPRFDNAIALAAKLGVSLKTLGLALGHDVSCVPDDCENATEGN
jgi:DNA-binding XRE family transcriptional regulator